MNNDQFDQFDIDWEASRREFIRTLRIDLACCTIFYWIITVEFSIDEELLMRALRHCH